MRCAWNAIIPYHYMELNIAVGASIFHPWRDDFVDCVSVVSFPAFFVLTDNGTRISRIVESVLKRRLHGYVNLF
jgi:hypothetical protein